MNEQLWRATPGRVLTTEVAGRFRLVVQGPAADGIVRFSVLRYSRHEGRALLRFAGSGTAEGVRAAMAAAEDMAGQMVARLRSSD